MAIGVFFIIIIKVIIISYYKLLLSIYYHKSLRVRLDRSKVLPRECFAGDRQIPPRKIHPGCFPPEHSPPTKPGFAKYAVDANLLKLESSILTRAKRATNRNNAAKNQKNIWFFFGGTFLGGIYRGELSGGEFA